MMAIIGYRIGDRLIVNGSSNVKRRLQQALDFMLKPVYAGFFYQLAFVER